MMLDTLYTLSQIVAALAVIGSLIFVGLQVRQANRMMRDAAIRNHAEKFQEISRVMFEVPGLAELWSKGGSDFSSLEPGKRIRFVNFVTWFMRIFEELMVQHQQGLMDKDMWEANINIGRDALSLPGAMKVYEIRKHIFSKKFQAFHSELTQPGATRTLYE